VVGSANTPLVQAMAWAVERAALGNYRISSFLLYYRTVQQKIKDAWTFPGGSNDLTATVNFFESVPTENLTGVKIAKGSGDKRIR